MSQVRGKKKSRAWEKGKGGEKKRSEKGKKKKKE